MDYSELVEILMQNGDAEAVPHKKRVINTDVRMVGCSVPFVRQLAKKVTLEEAHSFPVHDIYEVDLLYAIKVAECRLPFAEKSVYLAELAQTIDNWAVCDTPVKIRTAERELYFKFFCDMLASEKPFVCRYGVVNLMSKFLDDQHIDHIFARLNCITQWGHYYVDMGVAWLVATAMAFCRDKTVAFMQGDGRQILNKSAYNKALQKMRESFRVSEADKHWTRSMKMV